MGQILVSLISRDGPSGGGNTPLAIVGPTGDVRGPDNNEDTIRERLPEGGWDERRPLVHHHQQQQQQRVVVPPGPSRSATGTNLAAAAVATGEMNANNRRHSSEVLVSLKNDNISPSRRVSATVNGTVANGGGTTPSTTSPNSPDSSSDSNTSSAGSQVSMMELGTQLNSLNIRAECPTTVTSPVTNQLSSPIQQPPTPIHPHNPLLPPSSSTSNIITITNTTPTTPLSPTSATIPIKSSTTNGVIVPPNVALNNHPASPQSMVGQTNGGLATTTTTTTATPNRPTQQHNGSGGPGSDNISPPSNQPLVAPSRDGQRMRRTSRNLEEPTSSRQRSGRNVRSGVISAGHHPRQNGIGNRPHVDLPSGYGNFVFLPFRSD